MPLKVIPPRAGKSPNYTIRGTYLGVSVDRSAGTPKRSVAEQQLKKLELAIERGEYPEKPKPKDAPTFLSAAVAYMKAGGRRKYIAPLIRHFREKPLSEIDQDVIDAAVTAIYPHIPNPATQNCYVYTPVSAILHHVLGDKCPIIHRPKGAKGRIKTDFMWPADAFAIIEQADEIDREFGLYLLTLLYTGIRKSEGLKILPEDTQPDERAVWLRDSKNGDPRMLKLREDIVERLRNHLRDHAGGRLFRFKDGGHFKHLLLRAKLAVCGLPCPVRRPTGWKPPQYRLAYVGFHTFRHTWATWMRRYGGADVQGLAETKNWRDPRSAARYAHVVAREEWDRVDSLPSIGKSVETTLRKAKAQ
jgi:integrase